MTYANYIHKCIRSYAGMTLLCQKMFPHLLFSSPCLSSFNYSILSCITRYILSVRLHDPLLEVGRETMQVLIVGKKGVGLAPEEVSVPDPEKSKDHRNLEHRVGISVAIVFDRK